MGSRPAVVNITHPKAGSQWIRRILVECVPELVVPTPEEMVRDPSRNPSWELRAGSVVPGTVYPAIYLPKFMFDEIEGAAAARRFVVIRDLRDTLVSGYFSVLHSHPEDMDHIREWKSVLQSRPVEDGMIFLFDGFTDLCAAIQGTWMESGDPLIRYEDLLTDDVRLLEEVLIGHCNLPVEPEILRRTVEQSRFENLSGGRRPGQEDRSSHFRKGVPGDWRNHFTSKVTEAFKDRFGDILIYAGYERDKLW